MVCIKETLHIIPGGVLEESVNIIILCTLQVSSVSKLKWQICVVVLGFFLIPFLSVFPLSRSNEINMGRILTLGGTPEQIRHPDFQIREI